MALGRRSGPLRKAAPSRSDSDSRRSPGAIFGRSLVMSFTAAMMDGRTLLLGTPIMIDRVLFPAVTMAVAWAVFMPLAAEPTSTLSSLSVASGSGEQPSSFGRLLRQGVESEDVAEEHHWVSRLLMQAPADDLAPPPVSGNDRTDASARPAGETAPGVEQYGEAPVDRTPQFLRQVTPLLSRGDWQFDYGLVYAFQEFDFPDLAGANLVRTDTRRRAWFTPLAVRYGFSDDVQLFMNLPIGWSQTEVANPLADQTRSRAGIGDLSFGATLLLQRNASTGRSTIATVRASAPTGDALNPLVLDSTGLGNGAWRLGGDLLWVQPLDPVILFYGLGYTHTFDDHFGDVRVRLGYEATYTFGLGFAANERVTLSTALLGSYVGETKANGEQLANTDLEPIRIRLASTIAHRCRLVEPFVNFGITETAPSVELGVIWTR